MAERRIKTGNGQDCSSGDPLHCRLPGMQKYRGIIWLQCDRPSKARSMMVSRVPNGMILRLISATWLVVVGLMVVVGNWSPAAAQVEEPKRFDLRIENDRVSGDLK